MRIAVVSRAMPPATSGQAIVLYRLLKKLQPDQYCTVTPIGLKPALTVEGAKSKLSSNHHQLGPQLRTVPFYRFGLRPIMRAANALLGIASTYPSGWNLARICRREKCDAIVACTGDVVSIPASYVAHRLTGLDLYLYMFDYFAYQFVGTTVRKYARWVEAQACREARGIIVPNEFMADELKRRYNVNPTVVRNPVELAHYPPIESAGQLNHGDVLHIVYTGAVYDAHYDAFRNLLQALSPSDAPRFDFHVYSGVNPRLLQEKGIQGPMILHDYLPGNRMPAIQRSADVLFLPLAFSSIYPEIIRTSAPGKLGEYLAAGRPILVHAPSDSFIAWYFRKHECGVVVDQLSPTLVRQALTEIQSNVSLRERIAANARKRAEEDFSLDVNGTRFAELLGLLSPSASSLPVEGL